jgi:hypothetical protein
MNENFERLISEHHVIVPYHNLKHYTLLSECFTLGKISLILDSYKCDGRDLNPGYQIGNLMS